MSSNRDDVYSSIDSRRQILEKQKITYKVAGRSKGQHKPGIFCVFIKHNGKDIWQQRKTRLSINRSLLIVKTCKFIMNIFTKKNILFISINAKPSKTWGFYQSECFYACITRLTISVLGKQSWIMKGPRLLNFQRKPLFRLI